MRWRCACLARCVPRASRVGRGGMLPAGAVQSRREGAPHTPGRVASGKGECTRLGQPRMMNEEEVQGGDEGAAVCRSFAPLEEDISLACSCFSQSRTGVQEEAPTMGLFRRRASGSPPSSSSLAHPPSALSRKQGDGASEGGSNDEDFKPHARLASAHAREAAFKSWSMRLVSASTLQGSDRPGGQATATPLQPPNPPTP